MNNNTDNVVNVGTPPTKYREWSTIEVRYHDFGTSLPVAGRYSPQFTCCGYQWRLDIYRFESGYAGIRIDNLSNEAVDIIWSLCVRDSTGKEVAQFDSEIGGGSKRHFEACDVNDITNADCWGKGDFLKRSTINNVLEEGTLTVEVRMRLIEAVEDVKPDPPVFIPKNPLNKIIMGMYQDEESADIVFELNTSSEEEGVGSSSNGDSSPIRKRAKTSSSATTFYAHRLILENTSSTLAELCKTAASSSSSSGDMTSSPIRIPITDVKPETFRHVLYYIYGGKLSELELNENAKEIIDAADRYGVVSLKLEAEACYVKSTAITVENMIDNLLYADSKNCALLKEAVVDFMVSNGNGILGKVSFDNVPPSTIADILTAVTRERNGSIANIEESIEDEFRTMRVSELRIKLDEKGLDVDGSREAMIAILKEEGRTLKQQVDDSEIKSPPV